MLFRSTETTGGSRGAAARGAGDAAGGSRRASARGAADAIFVSSADTGAAGAADTDTAHARHAAGARTGAAAAAPGKPCPATARPSSRAADDGTAPPSGRAGCRRIAVDLAFREPGGHL